MRSEVDYSLPRNAELAWKVYDHIAAHPEFHFQWRWLIRNECETVGCYFGWVCLLSGDDPLWDSKPVTHDDPWISGDDVVASDGLKWTVEQHARVLLNIGWKDAGRLSDAGNSIEDLHRLIIEIFGPRPAVAHA